ncbi:MULTISPECIES: hypothetical protein [unclassified Streptomyces]|uniref:hypothetical protein n=1 Tax=unclassified Streptomyces TaxID=2593676 RepID=UPI002255EBE9|nr:MULTISPECIES: hypothetical protein [unclassified Streptomyces]MCX4625213.1 hypothetical protein [Streptomyces sp. NBC_01443]WSW48832.1 hypothetical protein OG296_37685 [Streptomyces sp. NBC_01001]
MVIFLLLLLVAFVLGLIGAVVDGLFYLLVIAIAIAVADVVYIVLRLSRSSRRHHLR